MLIITSALYGVSVYYSDYLSIASLIIDYSLWDECSYKRYMECQYTAPIIIHAMNIRGSLIWMHL